LQPLNASKYSPSRYSSGNSSLNTPSNIKLYSQNVQSRHYSRHSIEEEKKYVLRKKNKYDKGLENYPQPRLTPHSYESGERPNSVTGSIKLRKSVDSNLSSITKSKLDMYNKGMPGSKNNLRKSDVNPLHFSGRGKRRKGSATKKTHQLSNKIFVNKHLLTNDPGAGERGQGILAESHMTESDISFDGHLSEANRSKKSIKSIDNYESSKSNKYTRSIYMNSHLQRNKINPIKIKNRNVHNRSNSSNKSK